MRLVDLSGPDWDFFVPFVKWITFARRQTGHDVRTGWREPILISGQGKAAQALYSAGGLVCLQTLISALGQVLFGQSRRSVICAAQRSS
jgi:hypothetical protein